MSSERLPTPLLNSLKAGEANSQNEETPSFGLGVRQKMIRGYIMSHLQYSTKSSKQQFLRWLQPGISRFKEAADIPQNLLSDQTVKKTCSAASDDLLIKTAEDLSLADTPFFNQAISTHPDLNITLATAEAQNIMGQRIAEQQLTLILGALAKVVAKLTVRMAEGTLQDPWRIARLLLVLTSASFSPNGTELLSECAVILNSHEPSRMIERFGAIAIKGEYETIDKIEHIILSNSRWRDWSSWFMEQGQSLVPQCWGRLVVSRQPGNPSAWNAIWDSLLNQKEETNEN